MAIHVFHTTESKTCRGKAGRSKAHPHYAGRAQVYVSGWGYVTRCTSCEQIVAMPKHGRHYDVIDATDTAFMTAFVRAAL